MASNDSNVLKSALTEGSDVKEIYMFGVKVWPICPGGGGGPDPTEEYYVRWTPMMIDPPGYNMFTIEGEQYDAYDFPSCYFSKFGGYLNASAFYNYASQYSSRYMTFQTIETNAFTIGTSAFALLHHLQAVTAGCLYIGQEAFRKCDELNYVMAVDCQYIDQAAFANCEKLQTVVMPNCSFIGDRAFFGCGSYSTGNVSSRIGLRNVSFSNCKKIGMSAFEDCYQLQYVDIPKCEHICKAAFEACYWLRHLDLPECEYIGQGAFGSCYSMSWISLPKCEYIGQGAFMDCMSLSMIKLGSDSVVTLQGSNAFTGCTALNSILVPSSLVSAYKTDSIWSWFSNKIYSI